MFDATVPVLVVGGGACGAAAALAAADAGAQVLVVEQDAVPQGTTSMSQGLVCAAGTAMQLAHGIEDDAERFYADIMAKTRGLTDPVLARAIARGAGPVLDQLVSRHDMPWALDVRFRAAYGHSRARVHGWLGHGGSDLVQWFHARLAASGVDVLTEARMTEVIAGADGSKPGTVLGIEIERPDGARERIGCDALVLAAGGFAANAAMVERYIPEAIAARCNGHEGNRGDAIVQGARLGGALADMGAYQGYAMLSDPQGVSVPPGVLVEGGVLVNAAGCRFVDESLDISGMMHAVMAQPGGVAWVVFDAGIEARCAYIPESGQLAELNAVRRGDDVAALARAIRLDGLDSAGHLAAALADAHRAQAAGRADTAGRVWGDDMPPQAPFCAIKVTAALYHTQGGLQTDGSARVLRVDGSALPNVFAGGGSARGVSGPASWGYLPAMGLCAALTLGTLAGQGAAALALRHAPLLAPR